jgi:hypothetical protein
VGLDSAVLDGSAVTVPVLAESGGGLDWLALDRGGPSAGLPGSLDEALDRALQHALERADTDEARTPPERMSLDWRSDEPPPPGRPSSPAPSPAAAPEPVAGRYRDCAVGPVLVDGELDRLGRAAIRAARWRFELAGRTAVDQAVRLYRGGQALDDHAAAWLCVLLVHLPVRDYAWDRVGDDFEPHLVLWSDLTRRAEPRHRAGPATLLAFTAWRAGEGATSTIALELALEADPRYPMAVLLAGAITAGVDPALWAARDRARPLRRTVRRLVR